MPRSPRSSLRGRFPDLVIPSSKGSSSNGTSSPTVSLIHLQHSRAEFLNRSIQQHLTSGWPTGYKTEMGKNTIRLSEWLRSAASVNGISEDPATVISSVGALSVSRRYEDTRELSDNLESGLIGVVYGSNAIELVGSDFDTTAKLCQDVFRGLPVSVAERTPEYHQALKVMHAANSKCSASDELRSHLEIVQHARALNYVIDNYVLAGQPMSESLLLQTHMILYAQLDSTIAGVYRKDEVAARFDHRHKSIFIRAAAVPQYMSRMVQDLAEESVTVADPYELAARYAHRFVNIHPFMDGNGRMQRIIMNAILLKYSGHVAPLGVEPNEREEYLMQAWRANRPFTKKTERRMRRNGRVTANSPGWC